jgi:signal transduction histidine kinase/ActR/RegA family two-component response regulator
MRIRSLHTQVNLVLAILTFTVFVQLYSSYTNLSTLIHNQAILSVSHENVGIVYKLERDVIDLQRNLLIYKETGSDSSIERFHEVIERVNARIQVLSSHVGEGDDFLVGQDIFSRMVSHIQDYEDNFTSVINAKSYQLESIEKIEINIKSLFELLSDTNPEETLKIQSNINLLEQYMREYLLTLDGEKVTGFNSTISHLMDLLGSVNTEVNDVDLKVIKKDFRRLVQLNRGYLYLVNVVMAGSANEFLFLTKKIRENATERQDHIEEVAKKSSKSAKLLNAVVSIIFLVIIIVITWYLSRKIILPIKNITDVFNVLSKGEEVNVIPSTNRKDEIGNLARSAEIFHQNNKLTQKLLVESQDMIANQEVLNIQLEQEKKNAEMAAESKSMFLANMSHEIRTPMNGIVGLVDLVLKTDLNSKQKRYLDRIAYSGQIMMNVINDILDFSKIEAGKMEIESVSFEVNDIIENVISSMQVRIEEKSLDFKIWITPSVPKELKGDPLRISQILLNLCSNSIKFTDEGSIAIKFDYVDDMLLFSVHDTGIGMNEQQVGSIFESFTQADGSISRKYGGTGLGLTIVKQLIKLMDGDIKVESSLDVGTQVYVKIKCEHQTDETVLKPIKEKLPVIHYIGRNGKSSAIKYVLEGLNIKLKDLSIYQQDSRFIGALPEHKYIIFEGFNTLDPTTLARCIDSGVKLFCIINSNENEEKAKLREIGNIEIYQHPFSPKQYSQFFEQFLSNDDPVHKIDKQAEHDIKTLSGHVLLVEDNLINQVVAGDMLESLGVTFDLAEDGLQAVDAVMNKQYDMVFMDVQMPKMDGYTATKTLREKGMLDVIICGLSANALKEDLDRAEQSGMNDYLTKPLKQESLKEMLEKYLTKNS